MNNTLTIEPIKFEPKSYVNYYCEYCNNEIEENYYFFILDHKHIYKELMICGIDLEDAIKTIVMKYDKLQLKKWSI